MNLAQQYGDVLDIPVDQWPGHHQILFDTRDWALASRWPTDPTRYIVSDGALLPFRTVKHRQEWINADANVLAGGFKYLPQGTLAESNRIYPHGIVMGPGYYTDSGGSEEDTRHLVEYLEHLCEYPIMFAYVYPGSTLSRVLELRDYAAGMVSASAWLPLPGTNFGDYLKMLNANRRRSARRELAAFDRAVMKVMTLAGKDAIGHLPTFAHLSGEVQRHHGNHPTPNDTLRQLHQFVDIFDERVVFFFGSAKGKAVAATMAVTCHDMILARDIGLEYGELSHDAMAYFNLGYYEIIRYAYEKGIRMVCSGISTFEAKVLRGFQLVPLMAYVPRGTSWEEALTITDRRLCENLGPRVVSDPFTWNCGSS